MGKEQRRWRQKKRGEQFKVPPFSVPVRCFFAKKMHFLSNPGDARMIFSGHYVRQCHHGLLPHHIYSQCKNLLQKRVKKSPMRKKTPSKLLLIFFSFATKRGLGFVGPSEARKAFGWKGFGSAVKPTRPEGRGLGTVHTQSRRLISVTCWACRRAAGRR